MRILQVVFFYVVQRANTHSENWPFDKTGKEKIHLPWELHKTIGGLSKVKKTAGKERHQKRTSARTRRQRWSHYCKPQGHHQRQDPPTACEKT